MLCSRWEQANWNIIRLPQAGELTTQTTAKFKLVAKSKTSLSERIMVISCSTGDPQYIMNLLPYVNFHLPENWYQTVSLIFTGKQGEAILLQTSFLSWVESIQFLTSTLKSLRYILILPSYICRGPPRSSFMLYNTK